MKTILFATDFSEPADVAKNAAVALAHRIDARLLCVHACVMTEALPDAFELSTKHIEDFRQARQQDIDHRRTRLQQMAESINSAGISAEYRLLDGSPAESICEAAKETGADLVVVGSHGRTGFQRMLVGSVAERVTRMCETSVLVARTPVVTKDGFRRILVPTDLEAAATAAIDKAVTLAADDATIDLLHCWQASEFPDGVIDSLSAGSLYQPLIDSLTSHAKKMGATLMERAAQGNIQSTFHLLEERATVGVQRFLADKEPAYDLVAVGTHGRTGIRRWLLGSVAEATVRYTPCSVLITRAPDA